MEEGHKMSYRTSHVVTPSFGGLLRWPGCSSSVGVTFPVHIFHVVCISFHYSTSVAQAKVYHAQRFKHDHRTTWRPAFLRHQKALGDRWGDNDLTMRHNALYTTVHQVGDPSAHWWREKRRRLRTPSIISDRVWIAEYLNAWPSYVEPSIRKRNTVADDASPPYIYIFFFQI